jgi:hypothetical protein
MVLVSKDEHYILDICDELLCEKGERQKRFDFLRGLPSLKTGRRAMLPVDAYYPGRALVIEYHELQHTNSVKFWNKLTACGLTRDHQRRRYDRIRGNALPKNGIKLVVIDCKRLDTDSRGRLQRTAKDRDILRDLLRKFLGQV